jgi:hypothetical protein
MVDTRPQYQTQLAVQQSPAGELLTMPDGTLVHRQQNGSYIVVNPQSQQPAPPAANLSPRPFSTRKPSVSLSSAIAAGFGVICLGVAVWQSNEAATAHSTAAYAQVKLDNAQATIAGQKEQIAALNNQVDSLNAQLRAVPVLPPPPVVIQPPAQPSSNQECKFFCIGG